MKYLLISLLFMIAVPGFPKAQEYHWKTGDQFYYMLQERQQIDNDHFSNNRYTIALKVINRDANQYRLQCTFLAAEMQKSGKQSFDFYSSKAQTLPLYTTVCLPMVALINKPFEIVMNDSGTNFTVQSAIQRVEKSIKHWDFPEKMTTQLKQYTKNRLNNILCEIFFIYDKTQLNDQKPWYSSDSSVMIKSLSQKPKVVPFDRKAARVLLCMSFFSDSLKSGVKYDSSKAYHFFAINDPIYGKDSAYLVNKLNIVGYLPGFKMYHKLLQSTPNWVLSGSPVHLVNKLTVVYEKKSDSALKIIRYFYSTKLFNNWVHDTYAQSLRLNKSKQEAFISSNELLSLLLKEKDTIIDYTIKPLYLWVKSQQTTDTANLRQIAVNFKKLGHPYLWYGRSARYGMLIFQKLKKVKMQQEADILLNMITTQLKTNQTAPLPHDKWMESTGNRRLVNKNLLAHAYYLQYQNALPDQEKALKYLSQAALYSPANTKEIAYESFYDHVLLNSKKSYRSDFAKTLIQNGNPKEGLKVLSNGLQANPLMIGQVRAMYDTLFADSTFPVFFKNVIMKQWENATDFSLKMLSDSMVSLKDFNGKWLLLDFWGTWCHPCREEMPHVQAFYEQITKNGFPDINLLTIAAYDTKDKVKKFLQTNHYTLPVAMANDSILRDYEIPGYPSKVLISPQGTWIPIRFGTEWQKVVKKYVNIYQQYMAALKKDKTLQKMQRRELK